MSKKPKDDREQMDAFFAELRKLLLTCPRFEAGEVLLEFLKDYEDNFYVNQATYWNIVKELANDDSRYSQDEQRHT